MDYLFSELEKKVGELKIDCLHSDLMWLGCLTHQPHIVLFSLHVTCVRLLCVVSKCVSASIKCYKHLTVRGGEKQKGQSRPA